MDDSFSSTFEHLTGHLPFPWQRTLFERFLAGEIPDSCDLPTGLGKTSVIPIWLIALAERPDRLPRRLVYVVNRRTVVDQTTDEVEGIRRRLQDDTRHDLDDLKQKLAALSGGANFQTEKGQPLLAISTLRGQYADNREWSADPSCPAVVVGTVDMIGSRLLFSGYGAGFKTKPLYAGLIGQHALLVHDEAHLEPAFQKLIEEVGAEQQNEPAPLGEQFRLRVMELSATPRGEGNTLRLGDADRADATVGKRINAKKQLHLILDADGRKLADDIAHLAIKRFGGSGRAILIFARKVEDVDKIAKKLPREQTIQLTGTLRGLERDQLVDHLIFRRFLPHAKPAEPTVYLVCTSAGEVGVNISADHMICDLSTFDSMTQRLGRVNRFGTRDDTEVHIFSPATFDEKDDLDSRLSKTRALFQQLNGDGSPAAISRLKLSERLEAFAPQPAILPVSDILFDAWAMTSIREPLPGRPKVEPYLHGLRDQDPPETRVAWREEVGVIAGDLLETYKPTDLLDDYPLKPHELLRDRANRVFKHLAELAIKQANEPVWVVGDDGNVQPPLKLFQLVERGVKVVENQTVLLRPQTGGLRDGMLDSLSDTANDVADEKLVDAKDNRRRARVWSDDPEFDAKTSGMRLIRRIELAPDAQNEDAEGRSWHWFERPAGGDSDGSRSAPEPVRWDDHTNDVVRNTNAFIKSLPLPPQFAQAVVLAAKFHDLGKKRESWQRGIGNPDPTDWHAKSGKHWKPRDLTAYRHEFGSLLDLPAHAEFVALAEQFELCDLIPHLVAAHHGYGRPYFPEECTADSPEHSTEEAADMARQVSQRFARLQKKYGRWGLAYLESLLRAADYHASAHPTRTEAAK